MLRLSFATPRRPRRAPLLPLLLLALGAPLVRDAWSQEPLTPPQRVDADWMTPIHGLANDPLAAEYGLWAGGPDYKVSFGRGVAFFPRRGEAGENAPLRWTTRSVRLGGHELLNASAAARAEHGDWRYVLHHGALDERYDVRREGVEQSFVLHAKPAQVGDLVIEGALDTTLVAAASEPAHGSLAFHLADGTPLVTYGSALAIDATGRTTPVLSSFVDGAIRLQLDGAWIAEASFPLVVDPLLSSNTVYSNALDSGGVEIATDEVPNMFLVARERLFAIGDYDLQSSVFSANGALLSFSYNDLSNHWSTQHPSAAHLGGSDRWVLAFERIFPLTSTARVYAYTQQDGAAAPAGVVVPLGNPAGTQQRYPAVGGAHSGTSAGLALVVFQQDVSPTIAATDESRIRGAILDPQSATFGSSFAISIEAPGNDCERPSVSRGVRHETDSWLVVYQQWNAANVNDDWDVIGRLVRYDGQLSNREVIASALSGEHALLPKIDGADGRFLVLHGAVANTQKSYAEIFSHLRAQRVDWSFADPAPSFPHARRTIRSAASLLYGFGRSASRPVAYNHDSKSHWGFAWIENGQILRGVRVGYDAGVVEEAVIHSQAGDFVRGASACFHVGQESTTFVYGIVGAGGTHPVVMRDLTFANSFQLGYGAGGSGDARGYGPFPASSAPHAGSEFYSLGLDNGAPTAPTFLLVAPAPGHLPLGNGYTLLLDLGTSFTVASGYSNGVGDLLVPLSLPTTPYFQFDVYWQFLQIDPLSGQPTLSNALRTFIR